MKTIVHLEKAGGSKPSAPTPWALWALGFRPFYLLAGAYATLAIPLWALQYAGWLPGLRAPAWHAHEMLFGTTLAIIVGFLFTAGRNWSGQPTPTGAALMALAAVWVAGRVLVYTPWPLLSLLVNVAFPLLAALALFRALRAGNNRRNYFFAAVLAGMGAAQGLLHAALAGWVDVAPGRALQLGLDAVIFVMAVMGGRVIPMFSNNGAPGTGAQRHLGIERLSLGSVLTLIGLDAIGQNGPLVIAVLLTAAAAHAIRLTLWRPWRTRRVALVWVLHAAYLWIPLHFLLRAGAEAAWVAPTIATHALTTGAIGMLTLGMMTRTARGHLGRPLRAESTEVTIYGLVFCAALLRVGWPLLVPSSTVAAVLISSVLWSAAYGLYVWRYGPWLCRARPDGKPG